MKTIKQTYHIKAPLNEVWDCFVEPKVINAWGGGPAKMDDKEGTPFKFWGGDIHGTNKEIVHHKKIVQEWYGGDWKEPSIVTFTFHPEKDGIKVELHHKNLPPDEADSFANGWKDYYLGAIKNYLEKEK